MDNTGKRSNLDLVNRCRDRRAFGSKYCDTCLKRPTCWNEEPVKNVSKVDAGKLLRTYTLLGTMFREETEDGE